MDIDIIYDSGHQHKRTKGMPAFVCFKGPGKQRASPAEIQQIKNAEQMNAHFNEVYKPLEESNIARVKEFSKEERRGLNAGRSGADIAQQAEQNKASAREAVRTSGGALDSDAATLGLRQTADAITEAGIESETDAYNKAQQSMDTDQLNLILSGRDKAQRTSAGLRQVADIESTAARNKLERDLMLSNTKQQAIGEIATAGAMKAFGGAGGGTPASTAPAPPNSMARNPAPNSIARIPRSVAQPEMTDWTTWGRY